MPDASSTLTPYEAPYISRIRHQLQAKGSLPLATAALGQRTEIDGVDLDSLTREHGSPLFVYSEATLERVLDRAQSAFKRAWPKTRFAWSYKTCYLRGICRFFHQHGSLAEVVSDFEYRKARRSGIPGSDIVFNGPWKPLPILETAAREGARIHVDNFEEIEDLEVVAKKLGRKIPLAIRINLNAGVFPQWGKFGFALENGQAWAALQRLHAAGCFELRGLHCHIGTFVLDPLAYGRAVDKLAELAKQAQSLFPEPLRYLDLGGGFPLLFRPQRRLPAAGDRGASSRGLRRSAGRRDAPSLRCRNRPGTAPRKWSPPGR